MPSDEFVEEFRALLQPVYAELLHRRGIGSGDIDPLLSYQMEQAETALADVVDTWLTSSLVYAEADAEEAGEQLPVLVIVTFYKHGEEELTTGYGPFTDVQAANEWINARGPTVLTARWRIARLNPQEGGG